MRGVLASLACLLGACSSGQQAGQPDMSIILAQDPAEHLSEYGLFLDASARQPAERVVGYDLINPLFTDYADKHRYVFVPEGKSAAYHETEAFAFPTGSVIVKTFAYDDTFIETRLLIHKADGWQAYPYVWNESGTEAVYTPIGAQKTIETTGPSGAPLTINYAVPNKNQCKTCHGLNDAVAPIGPKARNLGSQPHAWTAAGWLSGVPDELPSVPHAGDIAAPLNARARAYLDINCAHCHRAGGSASNSGLWLEWGETSEARLGILKRPTAAGRGSGDALKVVVPGAPDASILAYRMASAEAGVAMPELGRSLVHGEGVDLVRAWIAEMEAAPE